MFVSRYQVRDGEPVILIEKPVEDADGVAVDPDAVLCEAPEPRLRQTLLSISEARELAAALELLISQGAGAQ